MGEVNGDMVERRVIFMDPVEVDIYLMRQRRASLNRRSENMSRKERREALAALLDMIGKHEGEWREERLIAEFSLRYGYTKKTAESYLNDLLVAGRASRGEESIYVVDHRELKREAPKK